MSTKLRVVIAVMLVAASSIVVSVAPAGAAVVDDLRAEFIARAPVPSSIEVETGGPGENGAYHAWATWLVPLGSRPVRGHALAVMGKTKGVTWSKRMPICDTPSVCRASGKFKSGGKTYHTFLSVNGRETSAPLRVNMDFSNRVIWVP